MKLVPTVDQHPCYVFWVGPDIGDQKEIHRSTCDSPVDQGLRLCWPWSVTHLVSFREAIGALVKKQVKRLVGEI